MEFSCRKTDRIPLTRQELAEHVDTLADTVLDLMRLAPNALTSEQMTVIGCELSRIYQQLREESCNKFTRRYRRGKTEGPGTAS